METTKRYNIVITGAEALTNRLRKTLDFPYAYMYNPWGAVNFASGFVEACEWVNGYTANRPNVQQMDGYWWRFEAGDLAGMEIKVVDEEGNIFKHD